MNATDTLTTIFSHNLWANLSLVDLCAGLSDAQLDATAVGVYGSIRDTLQHIAAAERSYLSRISTGQPYRRPADAPPLTLDELRESVRASGSGLIGWAPKVQSGDSVPIDWDDGTVVALPCTILLTQAINHATEHRSQIMAILTHLGIQPPDLDAWSYFEAQRKIA